MCILILIVPPMYNCSLPCYIRLSRYIGYIPPPPILCDCILCCFVVYYSDHVSPLFASFLLYYYNSIRFCPQRQQKKQREITGDTLLTLYIISDGLFCQRVDMDILCISPNGFDSLYFCMER